MITWPIQDRFITNTVVHVQLLRCPVMLYITQSEPVRFTFTQLSKVLFTFKKLHLHYHIITKNSYRNRELIVYSYPDNIY